MLRNDDATRRRRRPSGRSRPPSTRSPRPAGFSMGCPGPRDHSACHSRTCLGSCRLRVLDGSRSAGLRPTPDCVPGGVRAGSRRVCRRSHPADGDPVGQPSLRCSTSGKAGTARPPSCSGCSTTTGMAPDRRPMAGLQPHGSSVATDASHRCSVRTASGFTWIPRRTYGETFISHHAPARQHGHVGQHPQRPQQR